MLLDLLQFEQSIQFWHSLLWQVKDSWLWHLSVAKNLQVECRNCNKNRTPRENKTYWLTDMLAHSLLDLVPVAVAKRQPEGRLLPRQLKSKNRAWEQDREKKTFKHSCCTCLLALIVSLWYMFDPSSLFFSFVTKQLFMTEKRRPRKRACGIIL